MSDPIEQSEKEAVLLTDYQPPLSLDTLCLTAETGCESSPQEYEEIIYVPMQRKFWLIDKQTAQELEYAATTLFNNTKGFTGASQKERQDLIEKLDLSHLMKFYFNPDPIGFLTESEQAAYADTKAKHEQAKRELSQLNAYHDNPSRIVGTLGLPEKNEDYTAKQSQEMALSKELNKFRRQGVKEAEKLGYVEDNGKIYTPEQVELKALIDRYIKNRQIIAENEDTRHHFKTVFDKLAAMRDVVDSEFLKEVFKHDAYYDATKRNLEKLDAVVKDQIEIILQLGTIGIATLEFALGHYTDDPAKPFHHEEAVHNGIVRVFDLHVKEGEREKIIDALEKDFSDWQFLLANVGASVPPNAFIDNLKNVIAVDNEIHDLMDKARAASDNFVPHKLFLPNIEDYQQPTSNVILQEIAPLREFTSPKWLPLKPIKNDNSAKDLYQFSLHDLALASSTSRTFAKKVADHLAGEKKVSFKNLNKGNEDQLLEAYFKDKNAVKIDVKDSFFDDNGLFDAARLYDYLENDRKIEIKSLRDDKEKTQWGTMLKMIIFKEDLLKRLMGFDAGYGAQLVRFLSKHTTDYVPFLHYHADISAKKPSLTNFTLFGEDIKLVASVYDGSVTSDFVYFPQVEKALNPVLSFKHHKTREPIELDLGYFFLKMCFKGWGFAGASLILSSHISLNASDKQFALTTPEPALRPAPTRGPQIYIGGDLFAGVQAGITGIVECKWCPPKGTRGHFWQRMEEELKRLKGDDSVSGNVNTALDPKRESNYKTLSQMMLNGAVTAGVGLTAAFALTVHKDKIRLRIAFGATKGIGFKTAVQFDIDPSAAVDILRIVLQGIRKNDNRPIGWYSDLNEHLDNLPSGRDEQGDIIVSEAFYSYITKVMLLSRASVSMAFAFTLGVSRLETLYKQLTADYGVMAAHLANPKDNVLLTGWFAELPPQAIGALFYHLTKDLKGNNSWRSTILMHDSAKYTTGELIANQQMALANCVKWLLQRNTPEESVYQGYPNTAQTIFAEAVLRMNAEGTNTQLDAYYNTAPDKVNRERLWTQTIDETHYADNIALIYQTMEREVTGRNTGLTDKDLDALQKQSDAAKQDFNENFTQLFWQHQQVLFNLKEFIHRRTERWLALNGKESGNETGH